MKSYIIIFTILFYNCCVANGSQEPEKIPTHSAESQCNNEHSAPKKKIQECSLSPEHSRAAVSSTVYRWPKGKVYYVIDPNFPMDQQDNIEDAMEAIENVTCVRFRQRRTEKNYIYFYYGGSGCNGPVGMQGYGAQVLNLKPGAPGYYDCGQIVETVIHEIMHALGCHHEMVRPDRDQYVTIVEDNIKKEHMHNFNFPYEKQETFGIPFDYMSIMMYRWNSFAIDDSKPTIIAKQPGVGTNMRGSEMSEHDIALLNTMYKCKKRQ